MIMIIVSEDMSINNEWMKQTTHNSPSLEGKYSEHGSPARRGAPSFRGTSLFVGGDTREGLVKINVARRAELSR